MEDALKAMASVLGDGVVADDVASGFSCGEADVLATVLVRAGYREAAITWLSAHAKEDEGEDSHYIDSEDRSMSEQEIGIYVDTL